jgi:hypothetical protein
VRLSGGFAATFGLAPQVAQTSEVSSSAPFAATSLDARSLQFDASFEVTCPAHLQASELIRFVKWMKLNVRLPNRNRHTPKTFLGYSEDGYWL